MRRLTPLVFLFAACDESTAEPPRIYPDDWSTRYVEVRGCRASPDHDLEHVALWIDPASEAAWRACVDAFPEGGSTCTERFAEGATFVKPQYLDPACTELVRLSIARRSGALDADGGWHYQEVLVDGGRERVSQDGAVQRCVGCHELCDGYDQRCYMDP